MIGSNFGRSIRSNCGGASEALPKNSTLPATIFSITILSPLSSSRAYVCALPYTATLSPRWQCLRIISARSRHATTRKNRQVAFRLHPCTLGLLRDERCIPVSNPPWPNIRARASTARSIRRCSYRFRTHAMMKAICRQKLSHQ